MPWKETSNDRLKGLVLSVEIPKGARIFGVWSKVSLVESPTLISMLYPPLVLGLCLPNEIESISKLEDVITDGILVYLCFFLINNMYYSLNNFSFRIFKKYFQRFGKSITGSNHKVGNK